MIVIHDFDLAKEMFNSETYTGRAKCHYHGYHRGYNGKNIGIITTEGDTWRTHRRFALSTLKGKHK